MCVCVCVYTVCSCPRVNDDGKKICLSSGEIIHHIYIYVCICVCVSLCESVRLCMHGRCICEEHTHTHAQGADPRVAVAAYEELPWIYLGA